MKAKKYPEAAPLPKAGFVRLPQILAVIPIGKSTLWQMVREGRFPAPERPSPISPRITVWRVEALRAYLAGTWKPEGTK